MLQIARMNNASKNSGNGSGGGSKSGRWSKQNPYIVIGNTKFNANSASEADNVIAEVAGKIAEIDNRGKKMWETTTDPNKLKDQYDYVNNNIERMMTNPEFVDWYRETLLPDKEKLMTIDDYNDYSDIDNYRVYGNEFSRRMKELERQGKPLPSNVRKVGTQTQTTTSTTDNKTDNTAETDDRPLTDW